MAFPQSSVPRRSPRKRGANPGERAVGQVAGGLFCERLMDLERGGRSVRNSDQHSSLSDSGRAIAPEFRCGDGLTGAPTKASGSPESDESSRKNSSSLRRSSTSTIALTRSNEEVEAPSRRSVIISCKRHSRERSCSRFASSSSRRKCILRANLAAAVALRKVCRRYGICDFPKNAR